MKALIKKINQGFVSLILAIFYLVFLAPAWLVRYLANFKKQKASSYWQETKSTTNLDSAY